MDNSNSSRRQINTELATRATNRRLRKVIREHTPSEEQDGLKLDFYCECSDPSCEERLALTLEQFEALHDQQSHFVIAKGHQSPSVEKVVKTKHNLQVVDKYAL